jgi:hypothetical protein
MAVLLAEGFELASKTALTSRGWTIAAGATIGTTQAHQDLDGRGGDYAINLSPTTNMFTETFSTTARWLHFSAYMATGGAADFFVSFWRSGAVTYSVVWDSVSGLIELRRGSSTGTLVDTSVSSVGFDTRHWFAIELVADNSAGLVNVYVDGDVVALVDATGDTQSHGSLSGWDQLRIQGNAGDYIDDIIITDSTTGRIDEAYVVLMAPTADVVGSTLTPSTGSDHYAVVDEIPPSSSEYDEATAASQAGFYTHATLPWAPDSILACKVSSYAARDGTITLAELGIQDGVTSYGTATAMGGAGAYVLVERIADLDPDTGAAWTETGVNDAEIGIRFT